MSWFGNPISGAEYWSLYPALQTVDMNSNILGTATEVQATNVAITDPAPEVEFNTGTDKIEMYRTTGDASVRVTDDILLNNGGFVLDTRLNPPTFNVNGNTLELRATDPAGANYVMSSANILPTTYTAQYYKSVVQNLSSGSTDITFDLTQPWNNTGGYITHVDGTTDFTVVQAGVYQLEFASTVLVNGSTFSATNKSIAIDITRPPTAEQNILINTFNTTAGLNYGQSVAGTVYLQAGDVINCRHGLTFTGATPQVQCVTNTFDYNTTFTWTFIGLGGATAYQNPPPVIQTAGTNALTPTNANTTFILTGGTTQNFTTAGLGVGDAGRVWFVKNSQASGGGGNDVNIQENGVAIAGITSVLHQRTNTTNTGVQTLYWNGTTLTMY